MQVNSGCSKIRAEPPVRAKQHGNFPRFDGAADSGSLSSKPATPTTNVTSGTIVTEASADTANSRVASRALQQGHADPNPMEVRTFFQLLREEDREAIRKHEIDHPPF